MKSVCICLSILVLVVASISGISIAKECDSSKDVEIQGCSVSDYAGINKQLEETQQEGKISGAIDEASDFADNTSGGIEQQISDALDSQAEMKEN